MTVSSNLERGIRDYRLLLDKGYPQKATLKLVGDRFALSKEERMILFRGVAASTRSETIRRTLLDHLSPGGRIGIDTYNVLFTLYNYRRGRPLFISTDGLLRDAGGIHGKLKLGETLEEGLQLLEKELIALKAKELWLWLDAPVSGSGELAGRLRKSLRASPGIQEIQVRTVPSADPFLRDFQGDGVATSDSAVAIAAKSPIYDLARAILEDTYQSVFYRISP